MEDKYKTLRRIITAVALGQMVLALGIMVYGLLNHRLGDTQSNLLMGGALLLYWLLMDIVEPILTHRFDGIVPEQKTAYYKFMVLDLVGFAGALYFLVGMNGSSSGLLGAVVFVVAMKPKRDNQAIFYGTAPIPSEADEDEAKEIAEETQAVIAENNKDEISGDDISENEEDENS